MNPPPTVLAELVRISLQTGLIAVIILGVQALSRRRLSPRWRCALWWLVVLRLLLPILPKSSFSIFNVLSGLAAPTHSPSVTPSGPSAAAVKPAAEAAPSGLEPVRGAGAFNARPSPAGLPDVFPAPSSVSVAPSAKVENPARPGPVLSAPQSPVLNSTPVAARSLGSFLWPLLGAVWLAGMLGLAAHVFRSALRMRRSLSGLEPLTAPAVVQCLKECREQMGVRVPLQVFETAAVTSPALYGFLRPRLLLPRDFTVGFSLEELRFVFLHELAHVKGRDLMLNWLLTVLQIVHWFNPLVWLAFARFRADRELACDALALSRAGAASNEAYGRTVLRLLQTFTRPAAVPGLVGILEGKRQLRHRIAAIAEFAPAKRGAGLAVVLLLALGAIALTDAKESGKEKPLPPVVPLSLTNLLVSSENAEWLKDAAWLTVPRGTQDFGGIEFHVEGMIHLQGRGTQGAGKKYRTKVIVPLMETNVVARKTVVIQRGADLGTLHLLGATRFGDEPETRFADVVWRYTDGSSRRTALQYGVHLRDWYRSPYEDPARLPYEFSKVIWWAPHMDPNRPGRTKRMYRLSLANPEPAKVVQQLEFVSTSEQSSLFFIGLTLDPLKPGQRPDNTPDLEQIDPPLLSKMELTVQDADSAPVPGARIEARFRRVGDGAAYSFRKFVRTDTNGVAILPRPAETLEGIEIVASSGELGSRKMTWDVKAGDVVPPAYTFKLGSGIQVGGLVVDQDDNPLAGVTVTLNRFWSGGEPMNKQGEGADFPTQKHTTDAEGRWQARGLPPELLDRISIEAVHPDFIRADLQAASSISQLRAGTFKLTLKRGLEVTGRVMDEQDRPIAGATVWAGKHFYSERQKTESDAQGRFTFRSVNEGKILFSVMAKGRKPDNQNFTVRAGMDEIVFRLEPGKIIRAHVQNDAGEALSGCRIGLEGHPGEASYEAYEFSATTDGSGNFEWNGTPDEAMPFYIFHSGYEAKRGVQLKPDEDNVVVLRHGRRIEGLVLDADTGQPVTRFRLGIGRGYRLDAAQFYPDFPGMKAYTDANGKFSVELSEEEHNAVMIEANDYHEELQKVPAAQDGVAQMVFRLKPGAGLEGIVTAPDGRPVPGVSVGVISGEIQGSGLQLTRGGLKSFNPRARLSTTDSSGHFQIATPPEDGTVLAVGPAGSAFVPIARVREQGGLVLVPNGRIEGVFRINGQPVAGQEFLFSLAGGITADFDSFKVTTDSAGRFVYDDVPAGRGAVVRLVKTSPTSWMHSHSAEVIVEPGRTTQVTLGDSGGVLRGQVRFETPPAEGEDMTLSARLSTRGPTMPPGMSAEQVRAFMQSSEWKDQVRQYKFFAATISADGSLVLDSIPPGTYTLNVDAQAKGSDWSFGHTVANAETTVTVPADVSPGTPIQLGDLVLKPVARR